MMLFLVLAAATLQPTSMSQSIINECSEGNSHVEMSECVSRLALNARSSLEGIEKQIRDSLIVRKNHSLLTAFDSTIDSYRTYRVQQCGFREAVAEAGNGAPDLRLACEAELDIERARQLADDSGWLNPGG